MTSTAPEKQSGCCEKCVCRFPDKNDRMCHDGNCECHAPEKQNVAASYDEHSHFHCWEQKEPACGIPLEKHTQCCLCEKQNVAGWWDTLLAEFEMSDFARHSIKRAVSEEVAAAKREAYEAAKKALTTDDGCWTCIEIRKRLDDLAALTNNSQKP